MEKTIIKYTTMANIAICSTMLCVSCAKSNDEPDMQKNELVEISINASQENSETRTAIANTSTNSVAWSGDNESISVFDDKGSDNHRFIISNGSGTDNATFKGTVDSESSNFCGLYPYTETATCTMSASAVTISNVKIPAEQTAVSSSFDPDAAVMTAYSQGSTSMEFKYVCSFVKVQTTVECKQIEIYAGNEDAIAGTFDITVDPATGTYTNATAHQGTSTSNCIILKPAANESSIKAGTYYIAVLPGTFHGLECTLVTDDNSYITRLTHNETTFTRKKVKNLGSTADFTTYSFVTIGGAKWATANVGATSDTSNGRYFSWGDVTGYDSSESHQFTWANYKWMTTGQSTWQFINKYTFDDCQQQASGEKGCWYDTEGTFVGDNQTELLPSDDAATYNWGHHWCMPTKANIDNLKKCSHNVGTSNEEIFTSGSITLKFPAAGYIDGVDVTSNSVVYWSRTIGTTTDEATPLYYTEGAESTGTLSRHIGCQIRPVVKQ